jgi:hypothetical protein
MKKCLVFLATLLPALAAQAQVLNPGFELRRTDGSLANWEKGILAIALGDSCPTDSLYIISADAHSGNAALELRTLNCESSVLKSSIAVSDDIPAYSPTQPFHINPTSINFYYKLFPEGGDGLRVQIQLNDSTGTGLAEADTVLYAPAAAYTFASVLLRYSGAGTAARLQLRFSFVTTTTSKGGSRFLVDDIGVSETGISDPSGNNRLTCYPNPAKDRLFVPMDHTQRVPELLDMNGRCIPANWSATNTSLAALSLEGLPDGLYLLRLRENGQYRYARFLKHQD